MTDEEQSKEPVKAKPKRKAAPRNQSARSSTPSTESKTAAAAPEDASQSSESKADTPAAPPPPPPAVTQTEKASAPPPAAPVQEAKKSGSPLGAIALVLVLALAAGGFFIYQQLQKQIEGLNQELVQSQNGNEQSSQQLEQNISGLSEQMQAYSEATDTQLDLLEKQVGKSKRQWLIVEAEYLASVANVRLQLAGDVSTSIAALRAADQRLKDNGSPALYAIRKQIAKEIGILQSTALPDVVGISSRILSLESRVGALKVSDPHTGVAQAPGVGGDGVQPVPEDWEMALKSAWDNFSKMVVVRRNDKPISAMMTPEQVDVIQKNLALKLETARLALVHQDETLYQASLDIVAQWLTDYFDETQHEVSAALAEIKALKKEKIIPVLPDISGSLMALRDLPVLQMSGEPVVAPEPAVEPASVKPAEDAAPVTEKAVEEAAAVEQSAVPETGTEATAPAEEKTAEEAAPATDADKVVEQPAQQ